MNEFDKQISHVTGNGLYSNALKTLQVNVGLLCNQQCKHCHLSASPKRSEIMQWSTMEQVIQAAEAMGCLLVDITGGAPELNPHIRHFIKALHKNNHKIQLRTNLSVLLEPGMEDMPAFFKEHNVHLVGSLPCYLEENVRAQRGMGVYEKSIAALKKLNSIGYGMDPDLTLKLVYNPGGAFLPPDQAELEADYRKKLKDNFNVEFSGLLTITNMPIGNFWRSLQGDDSREKYLHLLQQSFNPQTVDSLMCREQLSVGWDGRLYDCDFNLALGYTVNHSAPNHIKDVDISLLVKRQIVTGNHCFGCTAGSGSSCGGALVAG